MPRRHTQENIPIADSAALPRATSDPAAALANAVLRLAGTLGGPRLVAAVATIGHASPSLTVGEQAHYHRLQSDERRRGWLAGRAAIKAARERLGLDTDTAAFRFPDACTSLTHAAGYAIAVAAPDGALRGIGIDLEAWRRTASGITRFFLTEAERAWIEAQAARQQAKDRIRLWTIKEAVFKARPDNRRLLLTGIELDDPAATDGHATSRPETVCRALIKNRVSYASKWTPAGCVSLAYLPIRHNRACDVPDTRTERRK